MTHSTLGGSENPDAGQTTLVTMFTATDAHPTKFSTALNVYLFWPFCSHPSSFLCVGMKWLHVR